MSPGETIGTAVGFLAYQNSEENFSLDWGVYDLRERNDASADPVWLAQHPGEFPAYGICWFDYLSQETARLCKACLLLTGRAARRVTTVTSGRLDLLWTRLDTSAVFIMVRSRFEIEQLIADIELLRLPGQGLS